MLPEANGPIKRNASFFTPSADVWTVSLDGFPMTSVAVFAERMKLRMRDVNSGAELSLCQNPLMARDAYALTITQKGINVTASHETGVILALTTLWQLAEGGNRFPCLSLRDQPRCAHRGLMLDCVRHFFPMEELKRIAEQMARVKLNVLHWGLTNDQGWRIESRVLPLLNRHCGPFYTREEITELVDFCALRGIEVIPEIDMPGHVTALLSAYPEYSCTGRKVQMATCGGIYPLILCAGQESTYDMIGALLSEISSLFPGPFIHIGGDEAPKHEWEKCPCCQQKMQEEGLQNVQQLQGYLMSRAAMTVKKLGKTAICWNESLQGECLTREALIQYWTVDTAEPVQRYVRQGGRLIYSDMFTLYLDYPHACIPLSRVYGDQPVIDQMDASQDLYGMEACLWTEQIDSAESLEEHLFPRLYAMAEAAWTVDRDFEAFKGRLRHFLQLYHPADLACTPKEEWECDAESRTQRVLEYMNSITAAMSEDVRQVTAEAAAPGAAFRKRFAQCFLGYGGHPNEKAGL